MGGFVDKFLGRPPNEAVNYLFISFRETYHELLKTKYDPKWEQVEKTLVDACLQIPARQWPLAFYLNHNYIGETGILALCKTLLHHPGVFVLSLINCNIPSVSCGVFKKLLEVNRYITRLDLSQNLLRTEGVLNILSALIHNSTMAYLGLRDTKVDDDIAQPLVDLFKKNKTLVEFDLRHNLLTIQGFRILCNAIKQYTHILNLDLSENKFPAETYRNELQPLLTRNRIAQQIIEEEIFSKIPFKEKSELSNGHFFSWLDKLGTIDPPKPRKSKRFDIGFADTIGRRPTMEDTMIICGQFRNNENEDLFCVFDGHGGQQVASYLALVFVTCFACKLEEKESNVLQALRETYTEISVSIESWANYMGSTALTILIAENTLYLANAGDTRAVISRGKKAFRLSLDHKPDLPSELKRIHAVGGSVIDKRAGGVLAVSRAIGDWFLHPSVIADPFVNKLKLNDQDEFLIMACDGVWDVITDEEAVRLINKALSDGSGAQQCAETLRDFSLHNGSMDNISIIIILLNHNKPKT